MKKITITLLSALLLILTTGCNDEANKKTADKKSQREHMKQHVDTSGEKKITKLPF